jgi:polyribonucleotide nucleotidyltransferase
MTSSFQRRIGHADILIETGKLALQANGSVVVRRGDSMVLVTATMDKPREGIDFFPLTVDFEERLYARGRIPGGFPRREGRPSTEAILTNRLTDRPLRPLFPKGFRNDVQIVATALSADQENPLDILVINGASAALTISNIPFGGPIGASRVGYVDGDFVINPTYEELDRSSLDLVVAGTGEGVLMMEAGADELEDDLMLEAIHLGQSANQEMIALQLEMAEAVGRPKTAFEAASLPEGLFEQVAGAARDDLRRAFEESDGKADQAARIGAVKSNVMRSLTDSWESSDVAEAFETLLESEFRARILSAGTRPDGRGTVELREIECETSVLPRTHGSGLFRRGETQVLGVTTLGALSDSQKLDTLSPQDKKRFMLHYNFPPFSTGETGRIGFTGRREIGHGALAERALMPVLPDEEEFPYAIRIVAEVLGSNGSTSMGSACAATLALMDAGVPIKRPVAGISIGLVTGGDGEFATLTDIQGMEDHFGDMDFKVAGTTEGITAIQLDIKVQNISPEVIATTLKQARQARMEILDNIGETIAKPREEMSPYAPRMIKIQIPVDKIGAVIGPGGKTIRGIVEETKATVDVQDDGTVVIGSPDEEATKKAIQIIEGLTKEAKVGDIYTGKVVRVMNFGAFVQILPGVDGMVHISELANEHVPTVEDVVREGDEVTVEVIGVDPSGRISLSRRSLLDGGEGQPRERERSGDRPGGRGFGGDGRPRRDGRDGGRPGQRPRGGRRPGGQGGPRFSDRRSGGGGR